MNFIKLCGIGAACFLLSLSCQNKPELPKDDMPLPGMGGGSFPDDGDVPDFGGLVAEYNGEKADDANEDKSGSDVDIYWEANSFDKAVTVEFSDNDVTVTAGNKDILYYKEGAYVTIDLQTKGVSGVEIIASGKSSDGQLKIYGNTKFKLTLNGLDLTCRKSSAVNNQCKKRVFVHLCEGTTNILKDGETYSDEPYYLDPAAKAAEDRKGCFFSEGNMIFSGTGVLMVEGCMKHGIASDGYFYMRHGTTVAVTDAAKNAIHAKGDDTEGFGICIDGGLVYANTSADAGKAMKTDLNVDVRGGRVLLNTSGKSMYEAATQDTSHPMGIKAVGNVVIEAGEIVVNSSGEGSKGIKADGDITVDGGELNICVTSRTDGSEGLESKSALAVNGGKVYIYSVDDAMNASADVTINGGDIYAYSGSNDAIDSNGTINLNGGQAVLVGGPVPEGGIDCDRTENFKVNGGTFFGLGGSSAIPSSSSSQRSVIYNGISLGKDEELSITDSSGKTLFKYKMPRTVSGGSMFFSSAGLAKGDYTIFLDGSPAGTFASEGTVTTAGSDMGGGPGAPAGPGGPGGPGGGGRP